MKSEDIRKVMLECLNESCVAGSNRHLNAIIHPRRHDRERWISIIVVA